MSIFWLLALSYYVISREAAGPQTQQPAAPSEISDNPDSTSSQGQSPDATSIQESGAGLWTFIFAYYSLFIHILVTFFPLRACWTVWQLTTTLKKASRAAAVEEWNSIRKSPVKLQSEGDSSQSSDETLTVGSRPSSSWSDDTVDIELNTYADGEAAEEGSVVHAIVIPNYKEEVDVLRETLDVLASHPRARTCYDVSTRTRAIRRKSLLSICRGVESYDVAIPLQQYISFVLFLEHVANICRSQVYLGMEEREAEGAAKALGLIQQFVKKFRSIDFTSHPGDIPGEAAGKGSNLAWAARKLSAKYGMRQRRDVIITGIDGKFLHSMNFILSNACLRFSWNFPL